MNSKNLHNNYHSNIKLQKRIIDDRNFTYITTISFIKKFFKGKTRILDIGSGAGTIDFYLANRGHVVTGIDISKVAISTAKLNVNLFGLKDSIKFITSSFPSKKLDDNYDGILISEVLEHIKDDINAVNQIRRLMKPDSVLIASSPSINAPLYKMGLLNDFDKRVGHVRRYSRQGFKNLFISNGFKVLKIVETEGVLRNFLFTNEFAGKFVKFVRGPLSDIVTYLDNLTIPLFGGSNYYLVAVKS